MEKKNIAKYKILNFMLRHNLFDQDISYLKASVLMIMKHTFTTVSGVLWLVTAVVLFFYRLNKTSYNQIVEELKKRKNAGWK